MFDPNVMTQNKISLIYEGDNMAGTFNLELLDYTKKAIDEIYLKE